VEELALVGERLNYKKCSGAGPESGWVSISLKDKPLMEKTDTPAAASQAAATPAATASATPAATASATPAAPAAQESWSVKKGDYYVTLGVIFKKIGDDPAKAKLTSLKRKVGHIVHTTGKIWKGPTGGFWVELDISSGDSGAGPTAGYVMIDASGFGTPGPCLQIANEEDGRPIVLKVKKPPGTRPWDKDKEGCVEDKEFIVLQKTPISEVKAVIGMLFGVSGASVTVFGPSGGALKDDDSISGSRFEDGMEVKCEAAEKVLSLHVMTPLEDYEGQKLTDLTVKDSQTVGQMKDLIAKITGLKSKQMIVAKGKAGERVGEDAQLNDAILVSKAGYKDGDEVAFIYLGTLETELAPFIKTKGMKPK